jgi:membrane-associated protease RseP (regulator of RpoE activity)
MSEPLGIVLFALIILVSVCLHEAGHMLTAKAFGMKVTRYFAGFGPTLWSFKRGETEYGVKAIPLGGFVKIVGMTPQDDDVAPEDEARAMWRYPVWKRTIVMAAGSMVHFAIGFVLLWIIASFVGVPNPKIPADQRAWPSYIKVEPCAVAVATRLDCISTDPASPAQVAGLHDNDRITAINGVPVNTYGDMITQIRAAPIGSAGTIAYDRDGQPGQVSVTFASVDRPPLDDPNGTAIRVSALGVTGTLAPGTPANVTYGAIGGVGKAVSLTGTTFSQIGSSITRLPGKIPGLWHALEGKPRDPNGPISVVGASEIGGQVASLGLWNLFLVLAVGLNFFVGVFNLLPLLPLDGGHIVIATYERLRSRKGRVYRVDMAKVMPIFVVPLIILFTVVMGSFWLDITGR